MSGKLFVRPSCTIKSCPFSLKDVMQVSVKDNHMKLDNIRPFENHKIQIQGYTTSFDHENYHYRFFNLDVVTVCIRNEFLSGWRLKGSRSCPLFIHYNEYVNRSTLQSSRFIINHGGEQDLINVGQALVI